MGRLHKGALHSDFKVINIYVSLVNVNSNQQIDKIKIKIVTDDISKTTG